MQGCSTVQANVLNDLALNRLQQQKSVCKDSHTARAVVVQDVMVLVDAVLAL